MRLRQKESICTAEEKEKYRSLVGQLGWLSSNSRPDLAFDVLELSCKVSCPTIGDVVSANKCLRKASLFNKLCTIQG